MNDRAGRPVTERSKGMGRTLCGKFDAGQAVACTRKDYSSENFEDKASQDMGNKAIKRTPVPWAVQRRRYASKGK